jgi:hypothetical protein
VGFHGHQLLPGGLVEVDVGVHRLQDAGQLQQGGAVDGRVALAAQVIAELGIVDPNLGEDGRDGGVVLQGALEVEELPLDLERSVAAIDTGVGPVIDEVKARAPL